MKSAFISLICSNLFLNNLVFVKKYRIKCKHQTNYSKQTLSIKTKITQTHTP